MIGAAESSGPGDRERHRQAALRAYAILDTPAEAMFDAVARLAASICGTPMAAISLLDGDRQWFKAEVGLGMRQTGRDVSFCDHAAHDPRAVLEVADTHLDGRFVDNGLVTGDPHVRFYAGAPLQIDDGREAVGALCVLDREPRVLTELQRQSLVDLSTLTMSLMEGRHVLLDVAATSNDAVEATSRELEMAERLTHLGSWASDFATGQVHWSDELYRILGVPRTTPPSLTLFTGLIDPADRHLMRPMTDDLKPDARWQALLRIRRPDGERRVLETQLTVLADAEAGVGGVVGTARDVTEMQLMQDKLLHHATTDALTGLPNRTAVLDGIERALLTASHAANRRPTAVAVLSVANFRSINEGFGVQTADELLQLITDILRAAGPENAVLGRTGDGQFACVLPETSARGASEWCEAVSTTLTARPLTVGRISTTVELAAGVSTRRPRVAYDTSDAATRAAHDLLRQAVIACGNSELQPTRPTTVYQPTWQAAARRRTNLYDALHRAIDRNELSVVYQPLVSLADETIIGAEALVRWSHPRLGPIAPPEFIAIAERSGLIHQLGSQVLRAACREAARWNPPGPTTPAPGVSVNFSGHQLADDAILDVVANALDDSGLEPSRLTVEITETVLMRDPDRIADRLHALTDLGTKIAIDDFGTGYSSLAYLAQFPAHVIKVDKSFVDDLDVNDRHRAIVASILRLAESLGATTLAEGIETVAQRDVLRRLGCDRGQGYLFSRPVPAERMQQLAAPPPLTPRQARYAIA